MPLHSWLLWIAAAAAPAVETPPAPTEEAAVETPAAPAEEATETPPAPPAEPGPLPANATTPGAAEVHLREGCARSSVLCLDADGRPLADEAMPARVNAGAGVDVKVLGCKDLYAKAAYKIESETDASPDRLFRPEEPKPEASVKNLVAGVSACIAAADVIVLKSERVTVASAPSARTFRIVVTRQEGTGDAAKLRVETHEARIDLGRYYLDVGVMIPVVIGGDRKVVVEDTDQPGLKRLTVREDIQVVPALMLHVFPGGRDLGALSSFKVGRGCVDPVPAYRQCRVDRHRRRAANALGLQLGVELDFKHFNRLFFGGLFEPITGLSINAGLALTRLEYLRGGHFSGALIPAPTGTNSDGSADLRQYVDRYWAPRFYLGVTFSFDIFRTLGERRRNADIKNLLPE